MLNLLDTFSQNFIDFSVENIPAESLNWIARIINWLFGLFAGKTGGVIIGVVIFTLFLKTLTLPLDIYSRVKTKKQSLLMKSMRPQMEKLQKQYANDKNMYSQKVLELQKQHGYNPIAACLPMIVSLVIFMIVIGAFSTYSNYATLKSYNEMVDAYNHNVVTYVMTDETDTNPEHFLLETDGVYKVNFPQFESYYKSQTGENAFKEGMTEAEKIEKVASFVQLGARKASADYYRANKGYTSMLWIGNVWYPDSMLNKEMPNFENFSKSVSRAVGDIASYEESYFEVTYNLGEEKSTYNGYFVLIVLSIGFMFLQQFITMRSQKDANELSTVDGTAAQINKWMMILMPIIFGIFSFMYSAAFSVYMIVNTVFSFVSTLIINKIVSVRFDRKEAEIIAAGGRNNRKRLK